jgi:hypothetical protein
MKPGLNTGETSTTDDPERVSAECHDTGLAAELLMELKHHAGAEVIADELNPEFSG